MKRKYIYVRPLSEVAKMSMKRLDKELAKFDEEILHIAGDLRKKPLPLPRHFTGLDMIKLREARKLMKQMHRKLFAAYIGEQV